MAIKLVNSHILQKLRCLAIQSFFSRSTSTTSSTRSAEAVFIENPIEDPVIAVTDKENVDLIGPPDPISNLRPIVRMQHAFETELQQILRHTQDATQHWNQKFWAEHNTRFIQQRKEFVKLKQKEKNCTDALSAEEMSEFYKNFLDSNWKSHVQYNIQWYRKNFNLLFLALRASLPTSLHFVTSNGQN